VVSLDAIVLLMMFTFSASSSEMPSPSRQRPRLFVDVLLVTVTPYQLLALWGSEQRRRRALACNTDAAPLPLSAPLP